MKRSGAFLCKSAKKNEKSGQKVIKNDNKGAKKPFSR
jgi:hypothetical protein